MGLGSQYEKPVLAAGPVASIARSRPNANPPELSIRGEFGDVKQAALFRPLWGHTYHKRSGPAVGIYRWSAG